MNPYVYYEYYNYNDADFFTLILNPDKVGKFPVVVTRSPYVSYAKDLKEEELAEIFMKENLAWAENNYVLVFQHCRGQGKSSGAFVPTTTCPQLRHSQTLTSLLSNTAAVSTFFKSAR